MSLGLLDFIAGSCEVLFPRECLVCTRPLRGRSLCVRCHPSTMPTSIARCQRCFGVVNPTVNETICATCVTFPPPTQHVRYLWEYGGVARDLIRTMKYNPSIYLTRYSGTLMAQAIPSLFQSPSWDLIVPIPSSPETLRKRHFHPCYEMAHIVQRALPDSAVSFALQHNRHRSAQAKRTHEERLRGLRTLFHIKKPKTVHNKRILLVEDVITTGATILAAAGALRYAGARDIDVIALAQARVWNRFRARLFRLMERSGH
jgi:predicted amidophosphoribosyltransferase